MHTSKTFPHPPCTIREKAKICQVTAFCICQSFWKIALLSHMPHYHAQKLGKGLPELISENPVWEPFKANIIADLEPRAKRNQSSALTLLFFEKKNLEFNPAHKDWIESSSVRASLCIKKLLVQKEKVKSRKASVLIPIPSGPAWSLWENQKGSLPISIAIVMISCPFPDMVRPLGRPNRGKKQHFCDIKLISPVWNCIQQVVTLFESTIETPLGAATKKNVRTIVSGAKLCAPRNPFFSVCESFLELLPSCWSFGVNPLFLCSRERARILVYNLGSNCHPGSCGTRR